MNRLLKLFHLYDHIWGSPGIQQHLNFPFDTTSQSNVTFWESRNLKVIIKVSSALIMLQIFLIITTANVWKSVWRICILVGEKFFVWVVNAILILIFVCSRRMWLHNERLTVINCRWKVSISASSFVSFFCEINLVLNRTLEINRFLNHEASICRLSACFCTNCSSTPSLYCSGDLVLNSFSKFKEIPRKY